MDNRSCSSWSSENRRVATEHPHARSGQTART